MDNYIFISHLDQPGNDLYSIPNPRSIEENRLIADQESNCVAFNTSGLFKTKITNLVAGSGIYIKKNAYAEYLNTNKWTLAPIIDFQNYGLPMKQKVKGIILVISCQKYLNSRVKEFKMSKLEYSEWKVITVIGNKNLETETTYIESQNENDINLLTIQCEDTYLHLLKKLVMSMKYLLSTYDIQEGILRLGDDIEIMEDKLENFLLNTEKKDYMGWCGYWYKNNEQIKKYVNWFMANHYITHLSELPDISMSPEQIRNIILVPTTTFNVGTIVYFSLKSCQCLIQEMEKMNWNVLHYNELYGYVNAIEDIGISCLLFNNGILPTMHMFHGGGEQDRLGHTDHSNVIGQHTNKYKDA